jgi:hypothetical protein
MDYELTQKWPFFNSCTLHVNIKDNEHMMRGIPKKKFVFKINSSIFCISNKS